MARNPKYMQVAQDLKEKLATYSYNQKLPTEAELVRMYDVSRQTIRVCLDILREENIIRSLQGSGSYYIGKQSVHESTMSRSCSASRSSPSIRTAIPAKFSSES